jgi:D-alanyl-D-alanine carboxypeptidase
MLLKQLLTLLIFSICSISFGQQANKLKQMMHNHLKFQGKNPVYSIQVYISNPDSVFCDAVGFSDGRNLKADKDNQFKIASITKTFTATVILQMDEAGLLDINEPISKYLSDVKFARVNELHYYNQIPYGDQITVKQLLQHRSGLADLFTDASLRFYLTEFLNKNQNWDSEKLMKYYFKYRLNKKAHFVPDSGYFYSDVNYFLLGLIIEKISGQTLAKQFRSRIFEPLQMNNTYFEYYEPAMGNGKMAHSFSGKRDITKTLNTSYDWAGGGVISNTTDLAAFLKGLFECKLFKNSSTLKEMTTFLPHPLKSGEISYYGLGLYKYDFDSDYYGHGGFWGCLIAYCPANKTTFCGSINQVNPSFKTNEFIGSLIQTFNGQMQYDKK